MINIFYALLSALLCLTIIALMIISCFSNAKKDILSTFQASCFSAFIWCFFTIFRYSVSDNDLAFYIQSLKYIGVSLQPVFLYLHIKSQIDIKPLRKYNVLLLIIVPFLTAVATVTNPFIHLMTSQYDLVAGALSNRRFFISQYGPWFYVHCFYSYLFAFAAFFMLIRMFFLTPKKFRSPIYLMFCATFATMLANVCVVFNIFNFGYDITIFAVVGTLYLCFRALTFMKSANIVMVSRDHIYNNLSSMILVLDHDKIILDCNKKAEELFKKLDVDPNGLAYEDFIDLWIEKLDGRISPYDPSILTIIEGTSEYHNRIVLQDVIIYEQHLGYLVIVQEITQLYVLFRYLQDSALYDPLTGLYNRNMYTEKITVLNKEEFLPLGIIIGDVNNLKHINDTFGHLAGDDLLKNIANILLQCSPANSFVTRIGGDEFAIIIPNTTTEICLHIIEDIKKQCLILFDEKYGSPSIALGTAMVTDVNQDVQQVIKAADEKMYQDKNDRRRKPANTH